MNITPNKYNFYAVMPKMPQRGEKVKKLVAKLERTLNSSNIVNTKYCDQNFNYMREMALLNVNLEKSKDKKKCDRFRS